MRSVGESDVERTDREVLDESVRLSRLEFEHKSDAEMDTALTDSRVEWERSERKRMDEEVVDATLQESVLEEEQNQLSMAMKESKDMIMKVDNMPGASSSSGNGQYPESVYMVMSMGFALETCIQAYHLVGDNPEGILAYCCQNLPMG